MAPVISARNVGASVLAAAAIVLAPGTGNAGGDRSPVCTIDHLQPGAIPITGLGGGAGHFRGGAEQVPIEVECQELSVGTAYDVLGVASVKRLQDMPTSGSFRVELRDGPADGPSNVVGTFTTTITDPDVNPQRTGVAFSMPHVVLTDGMVATIVVETDTVNLYTPVLPGVGTIYDSVSLDPLGQGALEFALSFYPADGQQGTDSTLLVPQVGAGQGAGQATFTTEVTAVVTGDDEQTVASTVIARDTQNPTHKVPFLSDVPVVGRMFRTDTISSGGAGSLIVVITPSIVRTGGRALAQGVPLVNGSAVQAIITATLPDGRRFGQLLRGRPLGSAQPAGTKALLFTTHDPARYRVNVGLAAAADGTVARLTPLGANGAALAAGHDVTLSEVGANTQINDVFAFFGLGDVPDAVIEVQVISGSAFSYASVLDGHGSVTGTSDPTTQLPVRTGATSVTLLELGHIQGVNEYSGSAAVHNHSSGSTVVQAAFTPRGATAPAATTSFTLAPNQTRGWDDVIGDLFGIDGLVGTLVLTTSGAPISALGREFAVYRDASGTVNGTAGQLMPGLTDADLIQPGFEAHFLGLREGGGERSHLALYNPGPGTATVTVVSLDPAGTSHGSRQVTVRSRELVRVNNLLSGIDPAHDGGERRIVVTTNARVYALAYRVNATGDPVTLQPFGG